MPIPLDATALAYSSPTIASQFHLDIQGLYNALPDVNEPAPGGAFTAFSERAKYHVALDSEYHPFGRIIGREDLSDPSVRALDESWQEHLHSEFARDPTLRLTVSRDAACASIFELQNLFELAHKRLAAAPGALAEAIIRAAIADLSRQSAAAHVRIPAEFAFSSRSAPLSWPEIVEHEGPSALRAVLLDDASLPMPRSIPELVQQLIATQALVRHRDTTFTNTQHQWSDYGRIELDFDDGRAIIYANFDANLLELLAARVRGSDSTTLSEEAVKYLVRYFVVMEAIRQQLCRGVGLCCPYGDEGGCCDAFRRLFARVYDLTRPRDKRTQKLWQPPACLC